MAAIGDLQYAGRASPWPVAVASLMIAASVILPGCKSGEGSAASSSPPPAVAIGAAGSTFVAPIMAHWIEGYRAAHPTVQINYRPIGSGAGIEELKKGLTEFAASDAPLGDVELQAMPPLIQVPVTAGPVCLIYNLPQLDRPLRLSAKVLAGIYLGDIISWQDAAIAKDNPGLRLPRAAIIVVHRTDGSGTTNILTEYLRKVSGEWSRKAGHGLSVSWPVGLGAAGSKGVLDFVKQATGTVGYLELNYAKENGVPCAAIQNEAGEFVSPTPAAAGAAVEAFREALAKDVRNPIVDPDPSAKNSYPVSGLSFVLIPKERPDEETQRAIRDFVAYAISTGQEITEGLSYAKLPESVREQGRQILGQLSAKGQPLR